MYLLLYYLLYSILHVPIIRLYMMSYLLLDHDVSLRRNSIGSGDGGAASPMDTTRQASPSLQR